MEAKEAPKSCSRAWQTSKQRKHVAHTETHMKNYYPLLALSERKMTFKHRHTDPDFFSLQQWWCSLTISRSISFPSSLRMYWFSSCRLPTFWFASLRLFLHVLDTNDRWLPLTDRPTVTKYLNGERHGSIQFHVRTTGLDRRTVDMVKSTNPLCPLTPTKPSSFLKFHLLSSSYKTKPCHSTNPIIHQIPIIKAILNPNQKSIIHNLIHLLLLLLLFLQFPPSSPSMAQVASFIFPAILSSKAATTAVLLHRRRRRAIITCAVLHEPASNPTF